jgi:hypothetical protein
MKVYMMLLHLIRQLLHRNGSITVKIHPLKEKANLIFCYLGVYTLQKRLKLLEIQFLIF